MAAIPELDLSLESAYRAHYPALIRRARRWLPPDEAEDLVQETFLRAWMHHGGSSPGIPWLMTVLRNLAIDRSRRTHPELTDDPATLDAGDGIDETADKVVALEDRRRVRDALASLTAQQRAVITLREWAGMTQQEIADSLGTSVPSVESLLLRGRRRLKKALTHAMAAVLWPSSELWRKMKGIAVHPAAGGPGAVSGWTSTVANLATAATVVAAGAAAPLGMAGRGGPPPEDRVVETSAVSPLGGTVENTPTEQSAASGERLLGGGTTVSGSSDASTTGSGGSGTTDSGTGSTSDEGSLKSGTKPATDRPNFESDAEPTTGGPSGPEANGDADPTEGSEAPALTPPESTTAAPGASLST